jgi:D-glycero-D-manno-heptose 1,7-bisphosphate phosphatase
VSRWSAVFLDRDGTLNVKAPEGRYVTRPSDLVLLPGVGDALRSLCDAGVPLYVVTNQRGVARGTMSAGDLEAVHQRLLMLLERAGATVEQIYSCVHDVGACGCRKPLPGLLHRAADDHPEVDLARSVMVGDTAADVLAGVSAGCATVRLATRTGTSTGASATVTVGTVAEAVRWLLTEDRPLTKPTERRRCRSGSGRAP